MKLTVLVDNNTFIDRYFYGEPGVSYYIQDEDTNILFDVGYSDVFMKNAYKLDLNLNNTCDYLRKNNITELHPGHCTDLKSKGNIRYCYDK